MLENNDKEVEDAFIKVLTGHEFCDPHAFDSGNVVIQCRLCAGEFYTKIVNERRAVADFKRSPDGRCPAK